MVDDRINYANFGGAAGEQDDKTKQKKKQQSEMVAKSIVTFIANGNACWFWQKMRGVVDR